jgi:hypothetical protein
VLVLRSTERFSGPPRAAPSARCNTVVTARRSPLQSTYILPNAARSGADSNPHISCPLPLAVVPTAHSTGLNSRVRVADHGCCSSQHAQDAKSTPHRGSVFSSSPATTPDVLSSTSGIDLGFNTLYKLAVACYDVCAQRGEARSATHCHTTPDPRPGALVVIGRPRGRRFWIWRVLDRPAVAAVASQ